MILRLKICISLIILGHLLDAQPTNYYTNANGVAGGTALLQALHNIIKGHNALSYSDLETYYPKTDRKPNGKVYDMYSYKFGQTQPYEFTFVVNQCGNYNAEGDCFNKEHTWPQSLFNSSGDARSDLHAVYPVDGWVNNKRSNFPYGDVNNVSWTSLNGSKLGTSNSYLGYSGNVFEPIDSFKGDLARAIMYTACRYYSQDGSWGSWPMANKATLTDDAKKLLLAWHHFDPVSQKEIARNDSVYKLQNNRNPFIDYPLFADCIWGDSTCSNTNLSIGQVEKIKLKVVKSGHTLILNQDFNNQVWIQTYDMLGHPTELKWTGNRAYIDSLPGGMYWVRVIDGYKIYHAAFIR
jgi:endonuclease I